MPRKCACTLQQAYYARSGIALNLLPRALATLQSDYYSPPTIHMSILLPVICFRKISCSISCIKGISRAGISALAVRRHARLFSAGTPAEACSCRTMLSPFHMSGSDRREKFYWRGKRLIRYKAGWGLEFPSYRCLA